MDEAGTRLALPSADDRYALNVLQLDNGQSEDDLDKHIIGVAQELDLLSEVALFSARVADGRELSSEHMARTNSRASVTTDATSIASTWSRDRQSIRSSNAVLFHDSSRSSMSSSITSNAERPARHSISIPPLASRPSSSSLKSPFKRMRGFNVLRLSKSSARSPGCAHCPQDAASQRRALHELDCGHRLCTQALRGTVLATLDNGTGPARCCDRPIPDRFLRHVLDPREYQGLVERTVSSEMEARTIGQSRPASLQSKVDSLGPMSEQEKDRVLTSASYQALRQRQDAQAERLNTWSAACEADLAKQRVEMLELLHQKHSSELEALMEQHATAMNIAEDKQVKAEADLRELQERERKDNATALKHIEAYCSGNLASGEQHNRAVTEQDLTALDRVRALRGSLTQKHANAINVLRGEQNQRIRIRAQGQDHEVLKMQSRQRKDELALEQRYQSDKKELGDDILRKRQRLQARWDLEIAVCCKRTTVEYDTDAEQEPLHQSQVNMADRADIPLR